MFLPTAHMVYDLTMSPMSLGSAERIPFGQGVFPSVCPVSWVVCRRVPECFGGGQLGSTSQGTTGSRPVDPGRAKNGGRHKYAPRVLDTNRVDFMGISAVPQVVMGPLRVYCFEQLQGFEMVWNCILVLGTNVCLLLDCLTKMDFGVRVLWRTLHWPKCTDRDKL